MEFIAIMKVGSAWLLAAYRQRWASRSEAFSMVVIA